MDTLIATPDPDCGHEFARIMFREGLAEPDAGLLTCPDCGRPFHVLAD